jgi:threonine/homoserine efflux transporter RhtA
VLSTTRPGERDAPAAPRLVSKLPPQSFFLVSAVFHYLGPSFAVLLFARVSVLGVAWLRIATAAIMFASWRRPWRLALRLDHRELRVLVALGVVLAAMNSMFYLAVDRLPLSTVGAIEFLGMVLLAAWGVRTRRNVAALALTTVGVVVLTEIRLAGQPLGFAFAFGNCALFVLYVILGHKIANAGRKSPGRAGSTGWARRCLSRRWPRRRWDSAPRRPRSPIRCCCWPARAWGYAPRSFLTSPTSWPWPGCRGPRSR